MKVKKANILYQNIFEQTPNLYVLLSPDLTILAASNAFLKATMVTLDSIVGRNIFDVFPDNPSEINPTGSSNLRASLDQVLKNKIANTMAIQKYDIRRPEKQGGTFEERYWSPINVPIFDKGELIYILNRSEDVTAFVRLKELDNEQREINEALAFRTSEMEIELFNRAQEIQTANQKLNTLNQLKTQFFANVSHDLRTPLTLILCSIENLSLDPNITAAHQHAYHVIEESANNLLSHVNDLLDMAKLDAQRMPLIYRDTDVAVLLSKLTDMFTSRLEQKKINFVLHSPESLIAQVDTDKIQRIFMNLLSNAFKFAPIGGEIKCSLKKNKDNFVFIIDDNGPGIASKLKKNLFNRFYQLPDAAKISDIGTGLGLAIAKDFVVLHHGKIGFGKTQLGGACFKVEMPLKAPKDALVQENAGFKTPASSEVLSLTPMIEPETRPSHGGPLVMVVEDNVHMNQNLCDLLSSRYDTDCAFNGIEAWQKLQKVQPDLIITDLMMPQMGGDKLLEQLKQHQDLKKIPVIILTARADEEMRIQLLEKGAQDYIIKPFSRRELLARVKNILDLKQALSLKNSKSEGE